MLILGMVQFMILFHFTSFGCGTSWALEDDFRMVPPAALPVDGTGGGALGSTKLHRTPCLEQLVQGLFSSHCDLRLAVLYRKVTRRLVIAFAQTITVRTHGVGRPAW